MNSWSQKKVLVFGLGLNQGGAGTAKFFASHESNVRVTDLRDKKILQPSIDELKKFPQIEYSLGGHKNEDIDWADLIIKNPAVKRDNKFLEYARKKEKVIETDFGIFFQLVNKSQIIAVTGTKGKSTTASLIYEVLKKNGKKAVLAGNIGRSVLDTLNIIKKNTLIVLEISSFQLEGLLPHKVSPRFAVVTNIYPDHLNYYPNMFEYISAKRLIAQFQTKDDFLFINKDNSILNNSKFVKGLSSSIIFYSKNDLPENFKPTLLGKHNLENYAAALAVAQKFSISKNKAIKAVNKFKGIEFRLQLIKNWNGIKIFNDTTATGPDSAIKALQTFPDSIVICGGMNKGMRYQKFVKILEKKAKKVFLLIGDSTDEIKKLIKNKKIIFGTYDDIEKLLKDVKRTAEPGDTILFSPGATSFNLYKNEFDRGRKFNEAVEKIFK